MTTKLNRRAQSLIEVLVAAVILTTGGIVVWSASQRNVAEAAWGAERVMCEGLLNDLVTVYRTYPYVDFQAEVDGIKKISNDLEGTVATLSQLPDDPMQKVLPLALASFLPQIRLAASDGPSGLVPSDPAYLTAMTAANTAAHSDVYGAECDSMVKLLGLKRMVLFADSGKGMGVATCIVRWKSRAGQSVDIRRQFAIFSHI
jgi:hypothetical protein